MVVVVTAAAVTFLVVVMLLLQQGGQLSRNTRLPFHGLDQLCAGQLIPGCRNDRCLPVTLTKHSNSRIQLLLRDCIRSGQNDRRGSLDLVIIKLTKVFRINLYFSCIYHSHGIAQLHILVGDLIHRSDHIRQLADTGRLDHDPVRGILCNDLRQCFTEIAYQTAANTSGIHFRNIDAGLLQKATVNTDLTKLIFDQDKLLSPIAFGDHFLNKCCFAGTEKAGINVDLCHLQHLLYNFIGNNYTTFCSGKQVKIIDPFDRFSLIPTRIRQYSFIRRTFSPNATTAKTAAAFCPCSGGKIIIVSVSAEFAADQVLG